MPKKLISLCALLPFIALLTAPAHAARTAPIYKPEPIQIPAGKGPEAVKKAIRKAFFDKDWEVREIGPGHFQGKHSKSGGDRTHVAVVNVSFDAKSVRISYKDSQELNYNKESGIIHKTYNSWVKNLERNIRSNLGSY